MAEPVGFLITWTCYGTWLYGDERGSVDQEHNAYGTLTFPRNQRRVAGVQRQMDRPPHRLGDAAREIVTQTIEDHARRRGWELLAVNVRSNHVHIVVRFAGVRPEQMMGQWKAWSTRRLGEHGLVRPGERVWTRHGSTRYLWEECELEPSVRYVLERQDEKHSHGI